MAGGRPAGFVSLNAEPGGAVAPVGGFERISFETMSKPLGPYVPVRRAGDFIFVSGQGGLDDGVKVNGGVVPETIQTMQNLRVQLESAGAAMGDVVKTTCFLTDMEDYVKFNAEYSGCLW